MDQNGEAMKRAITLACFLACLGTGGLRAQENLFEAPDGTVGVAYSFDFGAVLEKLIAPYLTNLPTGVSFAFTFTLGSGTPPPGLSLTSNTLSGTPSQPGVYTFAVDLTFSASYMGQTYSSPQIPIPQFVTIGGSVGPALTVSPGALTFSVTQGATSSASQSVVLSSTSQTAQSFTVSASTSSGDDWLSASGGGQLAAVGTSSISVTVDPSKLNTGTYVGTVSISVSPANQQLGVNVTVTVSGGQAQLQVSQSGVRFQTVAGGANPPSQSVAVLNGGSGSLNLSVSTSTTSGGQWLSANSSSSTVSSTSSANLTISASAAGLAAGNYYGQVVISADGAANSPQTVSVVLNVASAGTDLGAFIYPYGLVFIGQAGGSNPAAQTISVTNPSPTTLTYTTGTNFGQGSDWFTVSPGGGSVSSTSPVTLTVQTMLTGLTSGVYLGNVVLNFAPDNTSREITVLLIVVPGATEKTAHAVTAQTSSSCTPTKLIPVFTQLGNDFSTVAAWPTPVAVTVVDDCGNFLNAGSVTASFSDGDPSLPLTSLNGGNWSATWQPRASSAQVVITVDAVEATPALEGTQSIGGALQSNPTTPSINAGGVVSAAKSAPNQPLAPGGFTTIYGVHLGAGQNFAPKLPFATQLGATQVILGGRALPLQYAGDGQVNAVIPYDVPPNSTQQLIVSNGPALSVPEPVVIAPAQPAVFAQADGSGVVFDVKPGTSAQVLVDPSHPMSAGDAIVIYCAGLGPVNPAVAAGAAAPSSPPAETVNKVIVTIGGKTAQVFFSGLVGEFAALYQVNAYVPKGITPGDAVPLVLSVMGFESVPVTVAVK